VGVASTHLSRHRPHFFHFHAPPIQEHALTSKVDLSLGRDALAYFNDPVNQPWAVKDPRLCFTLRFWLPFWRTPPSVLFVYRHPIEVARFLIQRGKGFELPRALYLWIAYNRLAIQNSQGLCRVVISDAALIQDGAGTLGMIYEQLRGCGVDVPRMATTGAIENFIDPSLHHHKQNHAEECHPTAPKLWKSQAASDQGFYKRTQVFVINERLMREQSLEWYSDVYKFDHSIAAVRRLESDEHGGLRVANVFVCASANSFL